MKKKKCQRFLVEVYTELSWTDTRAFVEDAVSSWGGQYFPGDEEQDADLRFSINAKAVKVKHYRKPRS